MKKQLLLLTLILFGTVYFSSLNNNGLIACDKACHAACCTTNKTVGYIATADDEDEYSKLEPQFPFVTL